MPKLEIDQVDGRDRVRLDGVDISHAIKADGVRIDWDQGFPCVRLTLIPVELRADLPGAVVTAVESVTEGTERA